MVLALTLGALAGLLAFLADHFLARLTASYWVPFELRWPASYAVGGGVAGLLVAAALALGRRGGWIEDDVAGPAPRRHLFSSTLALLYVLPVIERTLNALAGHPVLGPCVAAVAVLAYVVWWRLLHVLLPREACWASGSFAAFCAALGLSINRNLVASAIEWRALVADAMVLLAGLVLVLATRRIGPTRALAGAGVLLAALLTTVQFQNNRLPANPAQARADAPHVVLLVIDTLRHDVFADVVRDTPEGQQFADNLRGSVWFSNAIAAAPWTAPSMGSIWTGLYPREHGFVKPQHNSNALLTRLAPEVPRLPEALKRAGYRSASWIANPILHAETGMARGFDRYTVLAGATTKLPILAAASQFRWIEPFTYQSGSQLRSAARRGVARLRGAAGEAPLLLWLHWMDPHSPLRRHDDLEPPVSTGPPEDRRQRLDRLYRNEVRYTLREVSGAIDDLRAAGIWDDALVILVADHGEMLPSDRRDRDRYGKSYGHGHALYDELVHVPLVIRPPGGIDEDRRDVDALVHHTDLHDTILDVAGIPPASAPRVGGDRISLVSWLSEAPSADRQRELAMSEGMHSGREQRSLRTLRWKWIDHLDPAARDELYRLAGDPGERRNLIDKRAARARQLDSRLLALIETLRQPPALDAVELDASTRRQLEALGYL